MNRNILYLCLYTSILVGCQESDRKTSTQEYNTPSSSIEQGYNNSSSSIDNVDDLTEPAIDYEPVTTTRTTGNTYSMENTISEESNSSNRREFSNFEETDDCVDGVVVYEGSGDYYIIETRKGLTICETYSGWLSEGDKVRGELNQYNFKYILNKNSNSEIKIYIEDYMLSETSALKWLGEHDHLKRRDQDYYDSNN